MPQPSGQFAIAVRVPEPADVHMLVEDLVQIFGQRHHALDDHCVLFTQLARIPASRLGRLAAARGCALEPARIEKGARVELADGRIFEAVVGGRLERRDRLR